GTKMLSDWSQHTLTSAWSHWLSTQEAKSIARRDARGGTRVGVAPAPGSPYANALGDSITRPESSFQFNWLRFASSHAKTSWGRLCSDNSEGMGTSFWIAIM